MNFNLTHCKAMNYSTPTVTILQNNSKIKKKNRVERIKQRNILIFCPIFFLLSFREKNVKS